jgi:hypothetical protein
MDAHPGFPHLVGEIVKVKIESSTPSYFNFALPRFGPV